MDYLMNNYNELKDHLCELYKEEPILVIFAAVGLGFTAFKVAQDLRGIYQYALRPSYDLKKRYGDNWAVVTGASDGIGKGFAFELAKRNFKVVLVGRNEEKLEEVKKELEEKYPESEFRIVVFDFNTQYTADKITELREKFIDIEKCSILVNNVGTASLDNLGEMSDENIHKQLNVNIIGNTVITKIFIPKLLANEKRAGIINIGSCAYEAPSPGLAVYSATKAYIQQFSTSLAEEYRKENIDVLVTKTAPVKTNMNSGIYLFTINPEQHATAVLDKLGHDTETHGQF